jgi:hypothetical protein
MLAALSGLAPSGLLVPSADAPYSRNPTVLAQDNAAPKPFIWTASTNDILAKVARARKALEATHGADVTK